jgi:Lrp/AsnC family transcriptional regulator for asnA, asnC and gidA
MNKAFILVNSEVGFEKQVFETIWTVSGIKEAYMIYGVYDIIIQIEVENLQELKETISHKIRMIKGVRATVTLIII